VPTANKTPKTFSELFLDDTDNDPLKSNIYRMNYKDKLKELPENTCFHVGISGGKDSTAVLLWMVHESGVPREKICATFSDTGNEHEWTYEQIELISKTVHPVQTLKPKNGFDDMVRAHNRFPSKMVRFCTQELKIWPSQDHIKTLRVFYDEVVAVSGVRADESEDRSKLEEWDYSGNLLTVQWRPLLRWKIEDVLAIHEKYNVPLNRLYSFGARRVGCWPCIMSIKAEIRNIALNFPERIDQIRELEKEMWAKGRQATFFASDKIPERFRSHEFVTKDGRLLKAASIDDVVKWSMTGKGAKGSYIDDPQEPIGCSSGFCE